MRIYIGFSTKKLIFGGPKILVRKDLARAARELLSFRSTGTVYRSWQPRDVWIVISARGAHAQHIILQIRQQTFSHRDKEDSSDSDNGGSEASS